MKIRPTPSEKPAFERKLQAPVFLVTYLDEKNVQRVSHGVRRDTLENVVIPPEPVASVGYYDHNLGEWVLR